MKKLGLYIVLIMMLMLMIVPSVLSVRYVYEYGIVPTDTGTYVNDSYIPFGSNVAKGNLVTTSHCTGNANADDSFLVGNIDGNGANGKEIVMIGNNTITVYHENCSFYTSKHFNGTILGSAVLTNINGNSYSEITFANRFGGSGEVQSFEMQGSNLVLIRHITGVFANINGIACAIYGDTYCVVHAAAGGGAYRQVIDMTTSVVALVYSFFATPISAGTFFVPLTGDISNNHTGTYEPEMLLAFAQNNGIDMFKYDIIKDYAMGQTFVSLISGTVQGWNGNFNLLKVNDSLGRLGFGGCMSGNSPSEFGCKIFNYDFVPIYTYLDNSVGANLGKGYGFSSADIDGDGRQEFVFVSPDAVVHVISDTGVQRASWVLTGYDTASNKTSIQFAIGEVNSSSYGKELITVYGVFKLLTNVTTKLSTLGGIPSTPDLTVDNGQFNLVDTNSDGRDELFYTKLHGTQFYEYHMVSQPTTTTTSTTTTTITNATTTTSGTTTTTVSGGGSPVCGNSICQDGETHSGCPSDCTIPTCGDGVCDTTETAINCPTDCGISGMNMLLSPSDSTRGLLPETANGLGEFIKGVLKLLPLFIILGAIAMLAMIFVLIKKIITIK